MLVRAQSRLKGRVRSWSALQMQGGASRPRVGWLKVSPNLDGLAVVFLYITPPPMRCRVWFTGVEEYTAWRLRCGVRCTHHDARPCVPSPDHLFIQYISIL